MAYLQNTSPPGTLPIGVHWTGTAAVYDQISTKITVFELLEISAAATKIGADWIKLIEGLHTVRDGPNGLKNPDGIGLLIIHPMKGHTASIRRFNAASRCLGCVI